MRNFLILIIFAVAVSCTKEQPKAPEQQAPVPVSTVTAAVSDVPETITSVGTVEAKNEAVVSAKVMGVIQKFWVDEGARVGKGSVLLTIDDAEIKAKRNEAEQAKAMRDAGAVDYLLARGDIAAGKIGVLGISLGAQAARLLARSRYRCCRGTSRQDACAPRG